MKNSVLDRLKSYFDEYFSDATKPTARNQLEIAAGMVRHATDNIGSDRQVFLLCGSWYPKGCVAGLADEYYSFIHSDDQLKAELTVCRATGPELWPDACSGIGKYAQDAFRQSVIAESDSFS